jgi:predicted dehydrogenase
MAKRVRVGIVGCGLNAVETHAPTWLKIPSVKLTAFCDSLPDLAQRAARRFGAPHAYEDLGTMISREDLDLVDVCTPPTLHEPQAIEALERACNVIVEKPMSLGARGADNMIKASQHAGRSLFVIHNSLFNPGVRKARAWIEAGNVGRITDLEVAYHNTPYTKNGWLLNKDHWIHKLPGGIITETLPHPVYLSKSFVGKLDVLSVTARKLSGLSWVKADDVRAILISGHSPVMIHVSYNFPRSARTMTIAGEKAVIFVDLETGLAELLGPRSESPMGLGTDYLRRSMHIFAHVAKECVARSATGHYALFANAVKCVLHEASPLVPLQDARDVVRSYEDVYLRYEIEKSAEAEC